ncbi:MAG: hypothetical protein Q9164_000323 [Protoblastenia rupestris]
MSNTNPNISSIQMARKLQDRLALASYKAQHGQEGLRFKDVEARLETTMKRKRTISRVETSSTYSSSSSSELHLYSNDPPSSPPTAPVFSDDIGNSRHPYISHKRNVYPTVLADTEMPKSKRPRSYSMAPPHLENTRRSWKTTHHLPQSSPVHDRHRSHFSTSHGPNISFASEISTIPDSPTFAHISDDEDNHRPGHSYRTSQSLVRSSPPRTPPPTRRRKKSTTNGEEGADLLLYLATSPSPANLGSTSLRRFAPSTPPLRDHFPYSMSLNTPGLTGFSTPGQPFNFADFVNVTPSPAQGAFGNRTPGLAKTPLAAKDARRRLNFDSLVPPSGSPTLSNIGRGASKDSGMGMELGGELVS